MAGSWAQLASDKGRLNSGRSYPIGLRYEFTADAADGTIPDLEISGVGGYIFGIDIVFDGTTPPNELTLVQKTKYGNTQWSPTKSTASGWVQPSAPVSVPSGCIISAAQTAAATNSAKGVLTIHIGPY